MSDFVDGVHVSEFLDDSLQPEQPSPDGDKKKRANPYLSNRASRKKSPPAPTVAVRTQENEVDRSFAVTPGDNTPIVARAARQMESPPRMTRVARAVLQSPERTVNALAGPQVRASAPQREFVVPDPTVNALDVPQVHVNVDANNNEDGNIDAVNNNPVNHGAIVPVIINNNNNNINNQRTVVAILPGDWRFTLHNMTPTDKFGRLFSSNVARQSEAWCNGLQTMDVVTTSYASRALTMLDDSDDEDAIEIHGMEGVSTHMTTGMSPLLQRVL